MTSTIRDFLPFGDIGPDLISKVAEDRPGLPVEDLASVFVLAKAAVAMFESIAEPLTEAGLSPARWRLLVTLRYQAGPQGASISEIASRLEVREPTVSANVDRAAADGLVQRSKDPADRRVNRVTLTDAGLRKLDELLPVVIARLSAFCQGAGGAHQLETMARDIKTGIENMERRSP